MKTAGRENPNHGVAWPHNRAHGAVGQNRSYSIQWAAKQEKFQPKGMCFFLTSTFIERSREPLFSGEPRKTQGRHFPPRKNRLWEKFGDSAHQWNSYLDNSHSNPRLLDWSTIHQSPQLVCRGG